MPAYAIAMVKITNPEKFKEYAKLAGPAVEGFGGRVLARGGIAAVVEGRTPYERIVVTEFASIDAAKACYSSSAYLEAQSKRIGAADFNMVIVEGS
ncbi:MAG: DUF1330 domain-containing protein [Betaproteobacteria bacterium]|nr:DUF1330 domain-containing protein [Betaproteobacteria bacterium]MBI2959497.1 DUF1330 domain-containing protein [Betaproteobacteria bacterium]